MTQPTIKLPSNADELLGAFPAGEPDFEAQAKVIAARIASGNAADGGPYDDLLKAPVLDTEPGEQAASDVRAAGAPKSNFAEMARKSLQKKDDSAELTKELLAATAQSRRPNAEMVERVRAAGRAGASATGTPVPGSPRAALPSTPEREVAAEEPARPSGVVARAAPVAAAPSQRGTIIGVVGAAFGIAACIALFLKSGETESSTAAALAAEKRAAEVALAAPQPAPAASAAQAKPSDGVLNPEALAAMPQAVAANDASKGVARPAAAAPAKAGSVASGNVAPERVELADDPAPQAVAAAEPKPEPAAPEQLKPAQGSGGDVPLTPSAGAVSTALSSVRGGAQACLAGQTEAVTATVTFAADGHVLRVNAGGPSGACIQAALSKARIAPFARDSFSASTKIRPP